MSVVVVVIAGLRCGRINPGLRHDVSVQHHRDSDLDVVIELELPPTRFLLLVVGGGGVERKAASFVFLPGLVLRIVDDEDDEVEVNDDDEVVVNESK